MNVSTENKWYVIRAVSGQEAKIKDYIMAEINRLGFSNNVEDIIVPTEKVIQIRNGKIHYPILIVGNPRSGTTYLHHFCWQNGSIDHINLKIIK